MAPVGPFCVTDTAVSAGVPVCVTVKVSGVLAGTLVSEPVRLMVPALPDTTDCAATGLTVGATEADTLTVAVLVLLPQPFDTVSERVTVLATFVTGAV